MEHMAKVPHERLHTALLELLEAWPLAMIGYDTDGRILLWNRAAEEMLGWHAGEVLGRTGADLHGSSHRHYEQDFTRVLAGETLANQEKRHPTKSGGQIDVSWSATPLPDADGKGAGILVLMEDITRRKQLEWALLESERFSRDIVDALPQNIAILNEDGTIIAVNKAWREFAAAHSSQPEHLCEEVNYLRVCDRATGQGAQEAEAYSQGIRAVMNGSLIEFSLEYPCHTPDRQSWYNGRVSRFSGEGPVRIVIAHENITELKLAEQAIQRLAQYDPLTGLPNRMLLLDRLTQGLISAKRDNLRTAVLFLDLDRFKLVNDSLGHAAGDKLLKIVAERLRETVRKSDTVARLGGDEFVVLVQPAPPTKGLTQIARKILQILSRPVTIEDQEIFPSTSIGIALFPDDGKDADSLLRCADMAMYRAKEGGRNTYHFFSAEMHQQVLQRITLEQGLVQALELEEFHLCYQEQTELHSGKIVGMEVFLRWMNPELGLLRPADFLPLAEETGLILPIGEWVLRNACSQLCAWRKEGLPAPRVSVNLSGRQLKHFRLVETICRVLDETGLSPRDLEVEVTENIISSDLSTAAERFEELKRIGISIAIDDFGTGISSLRNLQRLPIDRLKIDHTFLQGLATQKDAAPIIKTIIGMAHNLDLRVIAEGVETNEQRDFLHQQGCHEVQGYYFSRPVPAEEFRKLLNTR